MEQLRRGPARPGLGEEAVGESRIGGGEMPPVVDQAEQGGERLPVAGRRHRPGRLHEGFVLCLQGGQIPYLRRAAFDVAHQAGGAHKRRRPGAEIQVLEGGTHTGLPVGPRRDPHPAGQRDQATPRHPGPQPVAEMAVGLRDRHQDQQPATVPLRRGPAQLVDALGPLRQQRHSCGGQGPESFAPAPLGGQEPTRGRAGQGLAGGGGLDAEGRHSLDDRRRPGLSPIGEDKLAEQRQQPRSRTRPSIHM